MNSNVTKLNKVMNAVDTNSLMAKSLPEWRTILARECCAYVLGESYIARRLDQINFNFCSVKQAEEIVTDNCYILLRTRYLTKKSDEVEKRIVEIVKSFTNNLKSTLIKVTMDPEERGCKLINFLEAGEVAFRNGVFDFRKNDWSFKYAINYIEDLQNSFFSYNPDKIITWYINIDFEPIEYFNINNITIDEMCGLLKALDADTKNYCFELCYNIAHNAEHKFDIERFKHVCEIIGFTLNPEFVQAFVMLVGSGSNGKNSLFDGCFSNRVIPRPVSVSLEDIEEDRFATGDLHNHGHNIYLEASASTHTSSRVIKNITGSMFQMIEEKGLQKFNTIVNVKNLFSCNDQGQLKFSDTSMGFRRRINLFEIFYIWDKEGRYLKRGDYYQCNFSDDLRELKSDKTNTIIYIYLGMLGIKLATKDFTRSFKFSESDWKLSYSDVDISLKEKVEQISLSKIFDYAKSSPGKYDEFTTMFYDENRKPLYSSPTVKELNIYNKDDLLNNLFNNDDNASAYFSEHDVYICALSIKSLCGIVTVTPAQFTQDLKKLYSLEDMPRLGNNKMYIHCTFKNGKLVVLK